MSGGRPMRRSSSGMNTANTPASTAPLNRLAPHSTAVARCTIEVSGVKIWVVSRPYCPASSPPARPAMSAPIATALAFAGPTRTPSAAAARSLPLSADQARPRRVRPRAPSPSCTTSSTTQQSAKKPSGSSNGASGETAVPEPTPGKLPCRSTRSSAAAKPSVTTANSMPRIRTVATPSARPATPATRPPTSTSSRYGSAGQVSDIHETTQPPIAANDIWHRVTSPACPVTSPTLRATRALIATVESRKTQ